MALFSAYFDESYGIEDAYSVAGYVGTVAQWIQFEREWKEMLEHFEIAYLRKSELENLRGEFEVWRDFPKEKQDALKKKVNQWAISIIKRRVNAGFAASIKKSDWESIDKNRIAERVMGTGFYASGAKACLQLVRGWAEQYKRESVDYLFESGADGANELSEMLFDIRKDPIRRRNHVLDSWGFGDGKPDKTDPDRPVIVQFQAADFLAYETYRHIGNRVVSGIKTNKEGKEIPIRKAYTELVGHRRHAYQATPHFLLYFDKDMIMEFLNAIDYLMDQALKKPPFI